MTWLMHLRRRAKPEVSPGGTASASTTRPRIVDWRLALAVTGVAGLLLLSLAVGQYDIVGQDDGWAMFRTTRVPRTLALVLAGAAMAMSGLIMQVLTQNRFVEPTTTGTTEWAGLGLLATFVFAPHASIMLRMVVAVGFAFVGTMIFFAFLRRVRLRSSLIVPIVGIMLGAVVSAVSTFWALQTDLLQSLGIWFAGSFTSVIAGQYEVLWVVLVVVIAVFAYADRLTLAGLGEDVTTNLGLNYQRVLLAGTAMVAVAAGVVTVVVGNLPFLGLIVPNIVALVRGDDLRSNLAWVCLVGIAIVTVCDIVGRTIIAPFEMPVSVILGVIGAVVFIALIVGQSRRE